MVTINQSSFRAFQETLYGAIIHLHSEFKSPRAGMICPSNVHVVRCVHIKRPRVTARTRTKSDVGFLKRVRVRVDIVDHRFSTAQFPSRSFPWPCDAAVRARLNHDVRRQQPIRRVRFDTDRRYGGLDNNAPEGGIFDGKECSRARTNITQSNNNRNTIRVPTKRVSDIEHHPYTRASSGFCRTPVEGGGGRCQGSTSVYYTVSLPMCARETDLYSSLTSS